ncbi:unnamed protein product [Phytophthora fragariaefolia]|uniref:Unnamed protein product n=1 Tax=Phytophthora fragariaefolia TaxID=1490495 RepID=A0A9W6XH18_9STRA|nr:unnamed protein product [Phytophthora fragariaefolia]
MSTTAPIDFKKTAVQRYQEANAEPWSWGNSGTSNSACLVVESLLLPAGPEEFGLYECVRRLDAESDGN